jgi:hypothetical protein
MGAIVFRVGLEREFHAAILQSDTLNVGRVKPNGDSDSQVLPQCCASIDHDSPGYCKNIS